MPRSAEWAALLRIAELIAPMASTRFVEGSAVADDIEQVLRGVGIMLRDTDPGGVVVVPNE